uniref:Nuclear condensin complex subunit 3 C-terminal domain-containing protein n=1 Tax=Timema tahoe TaxID=61484 RepID=A0A7R9IA90_9NEOP|nr:unnamed protein product [Timema tahoe]
MSAVSKNFGRTLKKCFNDAQYKKVPLEKSLKMVRNTYDKVDLECFLKEFTMNLRRIFVHGEKSPAIDRCLELAGKFAASLCEEDEENAQSSEDDKNNLFVKQLFNFLLESSGAKDQSIRFRVCQFINRILNSMSEEASLDDDICNNLCAHMMERLQDKATSVRHQAVLALQRLQDPINPTCRVIKSFMFHLELDPSSEVRRGILQVMARSNLTIPQIIDRTRDVKDTVRKQAYLSLARVKVRSLTIKDREGLLSAGLKDRSEMVRNCVAKVVLPSWLHNLGGTYLGLLNALYVENYVETSTLVLKTLFKNQPLDSLMDAMLPLLTDKLIPLEQLTPENAFYWKCLVQFLSKEGHEEEVERIIPNLSPFVAHIKSFFLSQGNTNTLEAKLANLQYEFILLQLVELTSVFDLGDEMGRLQDLAEVISEIHQPLVDVEVSNKKVLSEAQMERNLEQAKLSVELNEIMEEIDEAVKSKTFSKAQLLTDRADEIQAQLDLMAEQAEVPSTQEQKRQERNDQATLSKCLNIVIEMMQSKCITSLTPQLRTLCQNFVLPCMQVEDNLVRPLAIKALGTMCLLNEELAKEHILLFYIQIANSDQDEVSNMALAVIFDLLLLYGLKTFQIEEKPEQRNSDKLQKSKSKRLFDSLNQDDIDSDENTNTIANVNPEDSVNLISILTNLLDSTSIPLRNTAALGLCKLLLASRIMSANLITRLIVMWFNPLSSDDTYMRQMLSSFFTEFVTTCSWSAETLEEAFLPTLKTILDAPSTSPLVNVNPQSVTMLLISITKPGIGDKGFQSPKPEKPDAIPLVTKYNPGLQKINKILALGFHILEASSHTNNILKKPSVLVYKQPPSLRNLLVHPKLETKNDITFIQPQQGSRPCNKTAYKTCQIHHPAVTFSSNITNSTYTIKGSHQLECQLCTAQYVGLTTETLCKRMNRHHHDTKIKNPEKPVSAHASNHNLNFEDCYTVKCIVEDKMCVRYLNKFQQILINSPILSETTDGTVTTDGTMTTGRDTPSVMMEVDTTKVSDQAISPISEDLSTHGETGPKQITNLPGRKETLRKKPTSSDSSLSSSISSPM